MSEIKVGDWIEVVSVLTSDIRNNIFIGDRYEVLDVLPSLDRRGSFLIKPKGSLNAIFLEFNQIKKAKPLPVQTKELCTPLEHGSTKKERVASSHYQNANNNDVWQFVDDNLSAERVKGFHQTNAIKYVTRYHVKHDTTEKRIEDLEKAKVCIDKLIELERLG